MKRSKKIFVSLGLALSLLFAGTQVFAISTSIAAVNDWLWVTTHGNTDVTNATYGVDTGRSYLSVSASGYSNSTSTFYQNSSTSYQSAIINGKYGTTNNWYTIVWDSNYNYSSATASTY